MGAPDHCREQPASRTSRSGLAVLAAGATLLLTTPMPAAAQREVPKIGSICPLGYVDLFNGRCSTLGLMTYTLRPTGGEACPAGWMNVGGGYCRER